MPKSLSQKILLQIAVGLSLVTVITTAFSYFYVRNTIVEKVRLSNNKNMLEHKDRESLVFQTAESNHRIIAQEFIKEYAALIKGNTDKNILKKINQTKLPDGFGVFVGKDQKLSFDLQARIYASYELNKRMGVAFRSTFQNTYFTFPEDAIVIYWPEFSNVLSNAENASLVLKKKEGLSSLDSGISKTAWTRLHWDETSNQWVVTASTPIYLNHRKLATIHHDLMMPEIFGRTLDSRLEDADGFYIVDEDGYLILHPDYLADIMKTNGNFKIQNTSSDQLKAQYNAISKSKGSSSFFHLPEWKQYLGVAKIQGPNWYLVTTYPESLITNQATELATVIFLAGLLTLLIEAGILYVILKKQVAVPLHLLNQGAHEIARGNYEAIININSTDEIGRLANSFNQMTAAIQQRDQRLDLHAKDLENLVEERSRELDEQKVLNMQASKMAALGEMAGGIAHEINTPLGTIQLVSQQMYRELTGDIPDLASLEEKIKLIEGTVIRVGKIIDGLRTFSRDSHQDSMEKANVVTIVNDTIKLCSEQLKMNGIQLNIENCLEDPTIHCRAIQLGQVLLNLIMNAKDAIQELPIKWIEVRLVGTSEWVEFHVTDSGVGIAAAVADKIFQPFFTTKEIGKGTGMGLSISLGIIKSHQGRIFVKSDSINTCIVVHLPRLTSAIP